MVKVLGFTIGDDLWLTIVALFSCTGIAAPTAADFFA